MLPCTLICFILIGLSIGADPNDIGIDIVKYIERHNYKIESYNVTTEDGYILTMHRITNQQGTFEKNDKPVVLLVHGLDSSSMDFVNYGQEKSIGLMLADHGYDVWLGNCRGNTWSRNHIKLKANERKFWEFSFHEIGKYDLPATIDLILNTTKKKQLSYIGHSQGTTSFFAMCATRKEYNEKINIMAALAPTSYMKDLPNPLIKFAAHPAVILGIGFFLESAKIYNLIPHMEIFTELGKTVCVEGNNYNFLCKEIYFLIGGKDEEQYDLSIIPVLLSNAPAGSSYKAFLHYAQEIYSGYFRQYDHGIIKNREIYKQDEPPSYNTSAITAPIALYYGEADTLGSVNNVERLAKELPKVVKKLRLNDSFSHLDFLWAKDVVSVLNNDLIALLNMKNGIPDNKTNGSTYYLPNSLFLLFVICIGWLLC